MQQYAIFYRSFIFPVELPLRIVWAFLLHQQNKTYPALCPHIRCSYSGDE